MELSFREQVLCRLEEDDYDRYRERRILRLRKMPYAEYLKSDHWKEIRELMIERANNKCGECGRITRRLEVHHVTYDRLGEELFMDLRVLCRVCHANLHDRCPKCGSTNLRDKGGHDKCMDCAERITSPRR